MATTAQQAIPGTMYRPTKNAFRGTWYTVPKRPDKVLERLRRKASLTCAQVALLLRIQNGGILAYRHVRRRLNGSQGLYTAKVLVALPAGAKLRAVKTRPAP
jgi:hypothetical protein